MKYKLPECAYLLCSDMWHLKINAEAVLTREAKYCQNFI